MLVYTFSVLYCFGQNSTIIDKGKVDIDIERHYINYVSGIKIIVKGKPYKMKDSEFLIDSMIMNACRHVPMQFIDYSVDYNRESFSLAFRKLQVTIDNFVPSTV